MTPSGMIASFLPTQNTVFGSCPVMHPGQTKADLLQQLVSATFLNIVQLSYDIRLSKHSEHSDWIHTETQQAT